jgi:hypothetical protein
MWRLDWERRVKCDQGRKRHETDLSGFILLQLRVSGDYLIEVAYIPITVDQDQLRQIAGESFFIAKAWAAMQLLNVRGHNQVATGLQKTCDLSHIAI